MKFARAILMILMCLPWSGQGAVALRNGIAAVVNDTIITLQELEDYSAPSIDLLRRTFARQPDIFQERYDKAIQDGLDQLLERKLILHEFKTSGGSLPESVIEERIKEIVRTTYGDRLALTKSLQARGITFDQFREQAREDIIITFMRSRNVSQAILISPAKIERYYTNNLANYELGNQVKLRMIVLNRNSGGTPSEMAKLANEIQSVVEKGASFADMASVYSEGSQRKEGGDWGWIESSKLNKGLSEVAFSLKRGEMSGVLALAREPNDDYWIYRYNNAGHLTKARKYAGNDEFLEEKTFPEPAANLLPDGLPEPYEFYLMLVEARRDARVLPLEEVRAEIENELNIQERSRLQKKWVDRLKEKSFIRYY